MTSGPDKNRTANGTEAWLHTQRHTGQVVATARIVRNLSSALGASNMNGQHRKNLRPGLEVEIVLKEDQRTGKRTRGIVKDILTKSPEHPHGVKVRLETGEVGRVKEIKNEG